MARQVSNLKKGVVKGFQIQLLKTVQAFYNSDNNSRVMPGLKD